MKRVILRAMNDSLRENTRLLASGQPIDPAARRDDAHLLAIGHEACRILTHAGIPNMVGGGVAVWAYGRRRYTKDIDLFIPPRIPLVALDALGQYGFHTRETDASWLYKAIKQDVLVDIIVWTTGNIRVNDETFERARSAQIDGRTFTLMGPEDVLFRKILSHKEERRDWYDGLSMLARPLAAFDWDYFLRLVGVTYARRTLSFLFYAQTEIRPEVVPAQVLVELLGRLQAGPHEPALGPILMMPDAQAFPQQTRDPLP
jgi:predicted nucleotidyltransferase